MALTFSDTASFAMVGSIAISTGSFLQSLDFIKNYHGLLPPFPVFLGSGLLLLLASGLLVVHKVAFSHDHVNAHVRDLTETVCSCVVLAGILSFLAGSCISLWLFLR